MDKLSIGELLKKLRKTNKFSQSYLAMETGYSEKQLRRIEQDISIPTVDLLHRLSKIYNQDLFDYYKKIDETDYLRNNKDCKELREAMLERDLDKMEQLVIKLENLPLFATGEPYQLIHYCKAYITMNKYDAINLSYEHCMLAIKEDCPSFTLNHVKTYIFSNLSYSSISSLGGCLYFLGYKEDSYNLYIDLLKNLELNYINSNISTFRTSEFHKRTYVLALYNLSICYMEEGAYDKAMECADRGIEFTKEQQNFTFISSMYIIKLRIYIAKNDLESIKATLEPIMFTMNLTNNLMAYNHLVQILKEEGAFLGLSAVREHDTYSLITTEPSLNVSNL